MASTAHPTSQLPSQPEWKDVLEDILPRQGEWGEEEYRFLTDHRNRLVEFTDGFLEVLPNPTDDHQTLLKFLFLAFYQFFEARGGNVPARRNGKIGADARFLGGRGGGFRFGSREISQKSGRQ